ncbi:MAG: AAA family ATPase, partial [Bacteroidota bacterium]|nr:AAA family ATPase [Bacteroidota bacterium]
MEALKGLYHADKLDEQKFIDNFTIRLKEYKQIIDNLLQQKKKPLQHFLITGKRGMGKSTLLRRIFIEAGKAPLNEKMLAVRLGTEQYRLSRLFKLWEQVIEYLGKNEPKLLEQKKAIEDNRQYDERLIHIVNDHLTETGKTLLLLIDNFDQFIDKLSDKDQHSLREALMMYPIQIIGNTIFYNEQFVDYGKPFFDFFKPIHLANLDKEEAEKFIKLRAESEGIENFEEIFQKQKGKINTLRILSGGVPRTLLILLSIIYKKNTGDAVDYLHEMIEQVTPLYQDRMKSLSPQQQEIMHHLAMHWDRTPVKDLATEMRIPSKSISAQLVQLENSGYINKIDTGGRNNYYEIDERFFNIWLLMSEAAPYDTKRVIWLTKWLDAFYSDKELKDFAIFCQNSLKDTKPGNRFLIAQALSESEKLDDEYKKRLVSETAEDLKDKLTDVRVWAEAYNKKLKGKETIIKNEVQELIDKQEFDKALDKLNLLEKINETAAFYGKGYMYYEKKDINNAEKYYLMAVEKGNASAMYNLGNLYSIEKKDIAGTEKNYLMAVEKGHVGAMYNLGNLYKNAKKDIAGAEKYYLMAVEKGHADAMCNLGTLYRATKKDIAGAEKYYLMAVEKGHADAMFNLAVLYMKEKKDSAGAEKYYLMAVEKGNAGAMNNLALLFEDEKKDITGAEKYYLMAVEKDNTSAMGNLANLYFEMNNISQKEKAYEWSKKAIELENNQNSVKSFIYIKVLLWNEKVKEARQTMLDFLNNAQHTDDNMSLASGALLY